MLGARDGGLAVSSFLKVSCEAEAGAGWGGRQG